jgi:hypothetical protein
MPAVRLDRGLFAGLAQPCLEIERTSAPPIWFTPAIWCPMQRQAEFIEGPNA